jgi:hypothetical protein
MLLIFAQQNATAVLTTKVTKNAKKGQENQYIPTLFFVAFVSFVVMHYFCSRQ